MNIKRILCLMLTVALVTSLIGCGSDEKKDNKNVNKEESITIVAEAERTIETAEPSEETDESVDEDNDIDLSSDEEADEIDSIITLEELQNTVNMEELQEFACQYYVDRENEKRAEWGENYIPVERKLCEPVGYIWERFGIDDGKHMSNNLIVVIPTLEIDATATSDGWLKSVNLFLGFCRAGDITVSDGKANIEFTETGMPHVAYFYQGGGADAAFPGYGDISIYDPVFEELLKTRTPRMFLEEAIQSYESLPNEFICKALEEVTSRSISMQYDDIAEYINGSFANTDNYVCEFINNTILPNEYEEVWVKKIISRQQNYEEHHLKPEVSDEPADGNFVY